MGPIAFNAGDIQATLTLDRSPFQRGLDEAKAEADRFEQGKYEAKLGADSTEAKRQITEARTEAERFSTIDAKAKIGVEAASLAEIDAARAKIDEFSTLDVKARIGIDSSDVAGEVERAKAQVRDFAAQSATLQVNADTSAARAQLAQLDRTAMAPKELKVTAQIQTALSNIDQVTARLAELQAKRTDPQIDLDIEAAKAKQAQLVNQLDALQAKKTDPKIDLDILTAKYNLEQLAMQLEQLSNKPWSPKVDAEMAPLALKVAQAQAQLEQLEARKTDPKIDADIAGLLVKIAQSEKDLQDLSTKRVDPKVDLDIAAAQAKLATLQAQLASLQAPAEQAAAGMAQFQKYALLAGAATPFIAAGIVALPGLIAAAVVPMAAVASGMDGIKQAATALGPAFLGMNAAVSQVFTNGLQPAMANILKMVPTLTTGLSGTASALSTMASQVTAVASSGQGLATFQSILAQVNTLITNMAPGIAGLVTNVMNLADVGLSGLQPLAGVVNQLSDAWASTIAQMNASGTASAAVSALVDVLGAVLNLLPPLVQAGAQLLATLGPPLAAAINVVADVLGFLAGPLGTVTTAVIALGAAWKAATFLGSGFTTAAGKISSTLSGLGPAGASAATSMGAAATATRNAGTAAAGAATNLSKVGSAIPIIGVAVAGLALAYDLTKDKADEFSKNVLNGSQTVNQAIAAEKQQLDNRTNAIRSGIQVLGAMTGQQQLANAASQVFGLSQDTAADATRKVTDAITSRLAGEKGLALAQDEVALAQAKLTDETNQYGAASPKAAAAAQELGAKQQALALAQSQALISTTNLTAAVSSASNAFGPAAAAASDAASSTKAWADAMTVLADPLASAADKVKGFGAAFQGASDSTRTFLQGQLSASTALSKFGEALGKIPAGVVAVSGAINTSTEAGQKLATNVLAAAKAYDGLYGATLQASQAAGDSMPVALGKAAAATEDYRAKLVDEAVQHGVNRQAAQAMINTYLGVPKEVATSFQTPGAVEATAAALGVKGAVTSLPDHKGIIIDAKGNDELIAKLRDLGLQITTLPNGKVIITADTQLLPGQIHDGVGAALIQLGQPKVPVGIDPGPAQAALPVLQQDVANTPGALPVGANGQPLQQQLPGLVGQVGGTNAPMPITADPAPFGAGLAAAQAMATGVEGVVKLIGDPVPFNGTLAQLVQFANGQMGTVTIGANGQPAMVVVNGVKYNIDATTGTMTLAANQGPAVGTLNGLKVSVDRTTGQITILGRDGGVAALKADLSRPSSSTHTINVIVSGLGAANAAIGRTASAAAAAARAAGGGAGGGLVGYSGGGIVPQHFARGGVLSGYAPGVDDVPAILSRGEAVLVPELVRLLGPGNILAANMAASGRQATMWSGPSGRKATAGGGNVDDLFGRMRGLLGSGAPMPDLSPLRSQVTGLRASASARSGGGGQSAASVIAKLDELLVALKTMKTSTVTTHVEVATTAAETASEIARVLARQEALGIFG